LTGFRSPIIEVEIPVVTWRERALFFIGRRRAFRVDGDSMFPTLKSGDTVLVNPGAKIRPGDIVAANHPYMKSVKVIKRVESIDSRGRFVLRGDNPTESTDSRSFGSLASSEIDGKVVCRFKV
jgi:nickel-type superoxide dismutase maturation protease